jgi:hypothetical protein
MKRQLARGSRRWAHSFHLAGGGVVSVGSGWSAPSRCALATPGGDVPSPSWPSAPGRTRSTLANWGRQSWASSHPRQTGGAGGLASASTAGVARRHPGMASLAVGGRRGRPTHPRRTATLQRDARVGRAGPSHCPACLPRGAVVVWVKLAFRLVSPRLT